MIVPFLVVAAGLIVGVWLLTFHWTIASQPRQPFISRRRGIASRTHHNEATNENSEQQNETS